MREETKVIKVLVSIFSSLLHILKPTIYTKENKNKHIPSDKNIPIACKNSINKTFIPLPKSLLIKYMCKSSNYD